MRISHRDRIKSCNEEKTCIGSFDNRVTQQLFSQLSAEESLVHFNSCCDSPSSFEGLKDIVISLPIFHPSSLTKRWEAKRNHFNLSDPAGDLIKKQYQFNNRKLSNHLPYPLPRSPTARVRQGEIWVQDYHLERSTANGKGAGSYGISLRSRKGLLKRSMSAPALREISSFRNDTLQRETPAACDESLDSRHL